MKSLTHKLALVFLVISIAPVIIGVNAFLSLRASFAILEDNDTAVNHLADMLGDAEESLAKSNRMRDNAKAAVESVVASQSEISSVLRNMTDSLMPKTSALSRIRFALADVAATERALLPALAMRHFEPEGLKTAHESRRRVFEQSLRDIGSAQEAFEGRLATDEERRAWEDLTQALELWRMRHSDFIDETQPLGTDAENSGPDDDARAAAAREAYDILLVDSGTAREECERHIGNLDGILARMSEAGIRNALQTQDDSVSLLAGIMAETAESASRAEASAKRFALTKAAAQEASESATRTLLALERRLRLLLALAIAGIVAALAIGIYMLVRISHSVRDMAERLDKLAKGNNSDDVPAAHRERSDEIGQLARSLQELIHSSRVILKMAGAMARGDYTTPIEIRSDGDELGKALQTMLSNSSSALAQMSRVVNQVGNGLHDVTSVSHSLSSGAQTSAQAVEEISQAVNHVDSQAKENAANARRANELATASREAARRGYDAVTELAKAMTEIRQAGGKIATVAKLIDDIAFQTNLLALNAAVEAARAGRQGKGFSVVADEVRNLRGRSARAARETSAMVAAMTERMAAGTKLAEKSDGEFHEIVEATSKVEHLFKNIAGSSAAQSVAMAQIAEGLGKIDAIIQENTRNAGDTATAAATLLRQADMLRRLVSQFKLIDNQARPEDCLLPPPGPRGAPALPFLRNTPDNA